MAVFLVFLLKFACLMIAVSSQQNQFNISLGSSLNTTGNSSSWLSSSGHFAFGFYQQGNGYAVGIFIMSEFPQKTVVWTANRDNPFVPSNTTLSLTLDGRLILQGARGEEISNVVVDLPESIDSASMLDSGNFVLYNSAHKIMWQSFDNPTNTLLPGQRLVAGQELISSASKTNDSKGYFRLKMQRDGFLVQYPVGTEDTSEYAYWAIMIVGRVPDPNTTLNLRDDGYLYVLTGSVVIHNLTDVGGYPTQIRRIYFAKINENGMFGLFSQSLDRENSSMVWESFTDGCLPKGLCGINSFCRRQDSEIDCKCLPGFSFVIQDNWRLGCARNFTTTMSCKELYNFTSLAFTSWDDDPYEVLEASTKEDCGQACLDDCICQVAFFDGSNCKKQKLPLRYGRTFPSTSNIALIKGAIPATRVPLLPPSDLPKVITKKKTRVDILIIGISLLGVSLLVLLISALIIYRNQTSNYKPLDERKNAELLANVALRTFTYEELQRATDDFKEEVGRGAFGTVYKGILRDSGQTVVAVKKLERTLAEGNKEFENEIRIIGKTHHRNLVQLLGYCLDGSHRLLVYAYMTNGSLDQILFDSEKSLNWDRRIEIATGVARGILYLHEECERQIIHCDIKPQNILLDNHLSAKISDFGLSKLLNYDQTKTCTEIRGTKGYVAPEWFRRLPVTPKADVYSFGIVLLEIVCRRKNIDWSLPENEAILDDWAYTCFEKGELQKLVGNNEDVHMKKLERILKIGFWCTQEKPSLRPSMKKVVLMLEGTVEIPVPPQPSSFINDI